MPTTHTRATIDIILVRVYRQRVQFPCGLIILDYSREQHGHCSFYKDAPELISRVIFSSIKNSEHQMPRT